MTLSLLVLLLIAACKTPDAVAVDATTSSDSTDNYIEAIDAAATTALFGNDPKIEVLFGGMDWSEGPLVLPNGQVICSDVPNNHILGWAGQGSREWLDNSGNAANDYSSEPGSNGLALNAKGQLVLCQHGGRQVAIMNAPLDAPRPDYSPLATHYEGKRFNSPNDLVIAADGSVLFTDPIYGLPGRENSELQELDFCGVYRITPTGKVQLLTKEYSRPNGIGLSPDEQTLYIANSDRQRLILTATPILDENFRLGQPKILIDGTELVGQFPGSTDGLEVASNGRIFATAPGGVWVLEPDGTLLAKVRSEKPVSNVALSAREDWLYLTNDDQLIRVKLE